MTEPATTSPRTFAFCPSLPAQEPPDRKALSRYLTKHGYNDQSFSAPPPSLLVIAPPPGAKASASCLKVDDLRVFQELLGGLVLYVDPTCVETDECAAPAIADASDWPSVVVFGNRRCDDISSLSKWLRCATPRGRAIGAVDPERALALAIDGLAVTDGTRLLKEASDLFAVASSPSAVAPSWWDVLFALHEVAASYDVTEHDINRYARHPFSQGPEALAQLQKKRDMLNTAADLWKSLKAAPAFRGEDAAFKGQPPRILLVDDNPEGLRGEIVGMVECLMPGFELWCWNPARDGRILTSFCTYNSMTGAGKSLLGRTAEQWHPGESVKPLCEILSASRFVLVDLLFRVEGKEREYGAELIRGLRRFCVDHPPQGENGSLSLPRFVAFSRSDDLEKIQKALRAGASGYVLKNRLLSLPADLARLRSGAGQDGCLLHRNFHALDFLPNETRGLLHEVCIPRIRFDRPEHSKEYAANLTPGSPAQRMAVLLRAIPKPDLHVHVGSCMTPEFLVVASLVMLAERHVEQIGARQTSPESSANDNWRTPLLQAINPLFCLWSGRAALKTVFAGEKQYRFRIKAAKKKNADPVAALGTRIRDDIKAALTATGNQLLVSAGKAKGTPSLRSILHGRLGIRDHWTVDDACKKLDTKDAVTLMLFALSTGKLVTSGKGEVNLSDIDTKDILRLFILFIAAQYDAEHVKIFFEKDVRACLHKLVEFPDDSKTLKELGGAFKKIHSKAHPWSDDLLEGKSWGEDRIALDVSLAPPSGDLLKTRPSFKESPLEFLIASGTRGRSLAEYLAGCEYAGAEHLQRACLMALYARQTLEYLVRHGVLYAELRAAVSGYAGGKHLTYQKACMVFQRAFQVEQAALMSAYHSSPGPSAADRLSKTTEQKHWLWCSVRKQSGESRWKMIFDTRRSSSPLERLFPAKVNLIFTGKRHKATREMMMEAAAGVMLSSDSISEAITASKYTDKNMTDCRVVGFDLAGLEESFPPEMFRSHFEQLSRMHIPITAHAGENASARFVESAVLDLRARRLGHGLALADDPKLMGRVREERICIELCPVSNYQTNEFAGAKPGREYPLKKFLEFGNIICLNTDNPIVSYTNIVKEFFQASYAYGGDGLSLWDALRMIRMGFAHAFKGLAERRALLELVEQMIFDLLIDREVEELLRTQAESSRAGKEGG